MRKGTCLIAVVAFIFCGQPVLAQGTDQEREACTPDVFRLCGQFIPDADRIETCLRNAGPRLSPACYVVFYPPHAASQPRIRQQIAPLIPPSSDDEE